MIEPSTPRTTLRASLFGPALLLAASTGLFASCGGGGGGTTAPGGSSSGMTIVSCSLGCSSSGVNPGDQFSCGITDVFRNQELRITFSAPIDPNSVNNNTFRLTEDITGAVPPGIFSIDSSDSRVLIFRPRVTFDSTGNPIFGLKDGVSYRLRVPGTTLDQLGPYIRNTAGQENASRLQCVLSASLGVFDVNPGDPTLEVMVDRFLGFDGNGDPLLDQNVTASGAIDVYRESTVRLVFDDVMDPSTLANPVTGSSDTIAVFVDPDGDTSDASDQVPLEGSFTLTVDQTNNRTTVTYTSSNGLPSAGAGAVKRVVVVRVSGQVSDLGGNAITNPGEFVFTPEVIPFAPVQVAEAFEDKMNEDGIRSGAPWGDTDILGVGVGGGSGRLGEIFVPSGTVIEFSTDSEDFSGIADPAIFNPANIVDRTTDFRVDGGVFEFSRLRVDAGGVLRFVGTNPARLYVRGECVVQGLLDVSGGDALLHDAFSTSGGLGGVPGPSGGMGGDGGMRPDGSNFFLQGGIENTPAGPSDVLDPGTYLLVNGQSGGGIPAPSSVDPNAVFVGSGEGGLAWPQPTAANPGLHLPFDPDDTSGMQFEPALFCWALAPGGAGGGGAHAFSGLEGVALSVTASIPSSVVELAPDSPGGDSTPLGVNDTVRTLSPEQGYLRGGGGGGGAGAHLYLSEVDVQPFEPGCAISVTGETPRITEYIAHSGAGGGGGGGGVQVAAGRRIVVNGTINARGGDGGSPDPQQVIAEDVTQDSALAQAGGGGAGGGVLLQSQQILIDSIPGRIDISGGRGGQAPYFTAGNQLPARGGAGSPGLLRIESETPLTVTPDQIWFLPRLDDIQANFGSQIPLGDFLTTEVWSPPADGVSARSGAQSCWIRPDGNFFRLDFQADGAEPGWDLNLTLAGQANPQSYRGANDLSPGTTLEQRWGSQLAGDTTGAPLIVRFQGARSVGRLLDSCNTPLVGVESPIVQGSLTEWVSHPAELSDFHGDPAFTPNIFRFVVIWDRSSAHFDADGLEAIEDLSITILPD